MALKFKGFKFKVDFRWFKRYGLYFNLGIFVLLAVALIIGIFYFRGQITELDRTISTIKLGNLTKLREINGLTLLKNDYVQSLNDIKQLDSLLISRGDIFGFESDVERLAQRFSIPLNVALSDIISGNELFPPSYEFVLSFTASQNGFRDFFAELNELPYLMVFDKIDFDEFDTAPLINIVGRVFVK